MRVKFIQRINKMKCQVMAEEVGTEKLRKTLPMGKKLQSNVNT